MTLEEKIKETERLSGYRYSDVYKEFKYNRQLYFYFHNGKLSFGTDEYDQTYGDGLDIDIKAFKRILEIWEDDNE